MKFKIKHKALTILIATVFILLSAVSSFADSVTYTYDANNRLVRANDNGSQVDYVYDDVGNLLQRTTYSVSSTPPSMDLGSINVGGTSTAQTFTITNSGSGNITIGAVVLSGADSASFALSGNTCDGQTLSPSSSCTVQAAFSPSIPGPKGAAIILPFTSPSTLTLTLPLTGTGFSTLNVSIYPSSTGSVTETDGRISCPGDCSETYTFAGLSAELTALPNTGNYFEGWTGDVTSPNNPVIVSMDANKNVTANFALLPVRIVRGTSTFYYASLQDGYNGAETGDTIRALSRTFTENLTINRDIAVTLQGGYDNTFTTYSGQTSSLKGALTTTAGGGTLTIRNFILLQ